MNFAECTELSATSRLLPKRHGLMPAFCSAARGVPSGKLDFVRQFRDLLIALEAVRAGATLVTENARDFARWKSLLGSTRKTLKLFKPSKTT